MPTPETRWLCPGNADAVATQASALVLNAARKAIQQYGRFKLVLAGGSTPQRVYRLLAQSAADWSHWQIYFGDERCLPAGHADRNSRLAAEAWLEQIDIPPLNVHPIAAELGAVTAAKQYSETVRKARPFDLVLLGMGEDGHTASLFPGQSHPDNETVHAVHNAPKAPPERVSLSRASLSDSHEVLILVTGAGKRDALSRWHAGEALPVASITAHHRVTVMFDRDAGPPDS